MQSSTEASNQSERQKYKAGFKAQALLRADRDGIPRAAADFGIPEATLDAWRENIRLTNEVSHLDL